jgi:hypothetical protein
LELHADKFQFYADAIREKGAPLNNVIGFIDGTVRPLCRPGQFQQVVYNGHKRVHALKFQSIVSPDGLIMNLFGPLEGRRHDCALLRESGVCQQFEDHQWTDRNGLPFAVYGDPAYPVKNYLIAPFRGARLNAEQQLFNQKMSAVRESVEWQFMKILQNFAFLDFKKNLKLFLQPVGKYYIVAAILTNCHTCLYGSITGQYFGVNPPSLEEYLS